MMLTNAVLQVSILITYVCSQSAPPPKAFFYDAQGNPGLPGSLPENTPIGTIVFFINASSPNYPDRPVTIELETNNIFSLLPNGSVLLRNVLNYERATTAEFSITVDDQNQETTYSQSIVVEDVNDVAPRFSQQRYSTTLPEDTSVGSEVFSFTVTDVDYTNTLSVNCSDNTCEMFRVETIGSTNKQLNGKIYLKESLDYESFSSIYQIRLVAWDGIHSTLKTFEVKVSDVADTPPEFYGPVDKVITEDVKVGTFVIRITARDPDTANRTVRFELTNNPGGFFNMDSNSGDITTAKPLDRESNQTRDGNIQLEITTREVLDNNELGYDNLTSSSTISTITILDVNDNPPTFSQTHYSVQVSESLANGQAIPGLIMSVTDTDGVANDQFKFVFTDLPGFEDIFEVNPPVAQGSTTASLLVKNSTALDYDRGTKHYTVTVVAREIGTSQNLSSNATVEIYLTDANDNSPVFPTNLTVINVTELTEPGRRIIDVERANDIDEGDFGNAGIRYSLIGNGNHRFVLDPSSALLKLSNCTSAGRGTCLDFESRQTYDLEVIAIDDNGYGNEARHNLRINLIDENDNIPVFTSDTYTYRVIEEETTPTADNSITINATDIDSSRNGNNRIRYGILTNTNNLFNIDPVSGALSLSRPILYSDGGDDGRVELTIRAGNLLDGKTVVDYTSDATVYVLVTDINNNAPIFDHNYVRNIPESQQPGEEIVQVQAYDADSGANAALTYSIVSGGTNTFILDSKTGIISRKSDAVIDFDITPQYNITVRATDNGSPTKLSGETQVTINIISEGDSSPVFNPLTQYARVDEDEAINHLVTTLLAKDPDSDSQLYYFFEDPISAWTLDGRKASGNFSQMFELDSATGNVRVKQSLDISKVQRIVYTVRVADVNAEAGTESSGYGTLTIEIIAVNNHAPVFLVQPDPVMDEELSVGSVVTIITASDDDEEIVSYEIIEQSVPEAFDINNNTGVVTVSRRIDYEQVQTITFTSQATDSGKPPHHTNQTFTVTIVNLNDNTPIFSEDYYKGSVLENTTTAQEVVTVSAVDADLPPYGDVRYRLPDSVIRQFTIDPVSGAIWTRPGTEFDREIISEIVIPVIAFDGPGTPRRSATAQVYITIEDVNDNSPKFIESAIYITLADDHSVGSFVTQVKAFDRDLDDKITYNIRDDLLGRYDISDDGIITTRSSLMNAQDHKFSVTATDKGGNQGILRVFITIISTSEGPKWTFPAYDGDKIVVCENNQPNQLINAGDKRIHAQSRTTVKYHFLVNGEETQNFEGFSLDSNGGQIFAPPISLDREQRDKYLVQVVAKDANGLASQRYLLIEVCDKDDEHPQFPTSPNYNFDIKEQTVGCVTLPYTDQCGRVRAMDLDLPENAGVFYTMHSDVSNIFRVDGFTGRIFTTRGLSRSDQECYNIQVKAQNYRRVGENVIALPTSSPRAIASVRICVRDSSGNTGLFSSDNYNYYASMDTPIGTCLGSVRPEGLDTNVNYTLMEERVFNGTTEVQEPDGESRFTLGVVNGQLCTQRMFNPNIVGHNYQLRFRARDNYGNVTYATASVWVTANTHKIKIVIDGDTSYVNTHRNEILTALKKIIGTEYVWIDSVGHHTTAEGTVESSRSDVIIYAAKQDTRHLYQGNRATINYINERITNVHYASTAASVKILYAQERYLSYLYLSGATTGALVSGAGTIPIGLLIAALLLLLLLLLPLLLLCCLPCCPCLAGLFGGKNKKYALVEGAPGYHQGTYIDDWYEQSKFYNNAAYEEDFSDNWDTGSAHMLVTVGNGTLKPGAGRDAVDSGDAEEITETTQTFYNQEGMGNGQSRGVHGASMANGAANSGTTMYATNGYAGSAYGTGTLDSTVIVDRLANADEEGEVIQEEHVDVVKSSMDNSREMKPLTSIQTTHTTDAREINQSSLSPTSIDMLDTASTLNNHMATRQNQSGGRFSHTAVVNRHGNQGVDSDEYISDSYTSHQSTQQSMPPSAPPGHYNDNGVTIILDAQPSRGLEIEDAEYEVVSDLVPAGRNVRTEEYERTGSLYRGSNTGTLPPGFTIELDARETGGMVADPEEYTLESDDDGLSPEFFAHAQRSPKSQRRYKKTTTRVQGVADDYNYY